jgi:hypothetical protein
MADRADAAAAAIMLIIQTHLRRSKAAGLHALSAADRIALRAEITETLRDELTDQRRQDRDEIRPSD